MNNILPVALTLANAGVKVYPLSAGSKVPVKGSHGEHDATTDSNTIRKWFSCNPNYNLAVNLRESGLVVIDLDNHENGANGKKNWVNLIGQQKEHMKSMLTYAEATPHAGLHLFYKVQSTISNDDIQLLPGVELLTGKVIVAPSKLKDTCIGYTQQWQQFSSITQAIQLPQWIIKLAEQAQTANANHDYKNHKAPIKRWAGIVLDNLVRGSQEGSRNIYLTKLCGQLIHAGADDETIWELMNFANNHNTPPLPQSEVEGIVASIIRKEMRNYDY